MLRTAALFPAARQECVYPVLSRSGRTATGKTGSRRGTRPPMAVQRRVTTYQVDPVNRPGNYASPDLLTVL